MNHESLGASIDDGVKRYCDPQQTDETTLRAILRSIPEHSWYAAYRTLVAQLERQESALFPTARSLPLTERFAVLDRKKQLLDAEYEARSRR